MRLKWVLYTSYLFIVLFGTTLVYVASVRHFKRSHIEDLTQDLNWRARLFAQLVSRDGSLLDSSTLKKMAEDERLRITIIRADGLVLAETHKDPGQMDNHGQRLEILQAIREGRGSSMRFSHTVGKDMLYVAIPVADGSTVVRTAMPVAEIDRALRAFSRSIALICLLVLVTAGMVAWLVGNRMVQQLASLQRNALLYAKGSFEQALPELSIKEFSELSRAFKFMAGEIQSRIRKIVEQRNEYRTVLDHMMEAVLAIDAKYRVVTCNRSARMLFNIDEDLAAGFSIMDHIHHPAVLQLFIDAWETEHLIDRMVVDFHPEKQILHAQSVRLHDNAGAAVGVLIVFQDVTHLRRLEQIRSDFVANVSHELKTPVSGIRGIAETMMMDNSLDAVTYQRFTGLLVRQAERLTAIIEDLLQLSRLEQVGAEIDIEAFEIESLLRQVFDDCEQKADESRVTMVVGAVEQRRMEGNVNLLQQALFNLMDNALKYSQPGGEVRVEVLCNRDCLSINVVDKGIGIAAEHISRLFERFYRVDKARSKKLGGTGLGLAIVKHIMNLHGGSVRVESVPEEGSRFALVFPLEEN